MWMCGCAGGLVVGGVGGAGGVRDWLGPLNRLESCIVIIHHHYIALTALATTANPTSTTSSSSSRDDDDARCRMALSVWGVCVVSIHHHAHTHKLHHHSTSHGSKPFELKGSNNHEATRSLPYTSIEKRRRLLFIESWADINTISQSLLACLGRRPNLNSCRLWMNLSVTAHGPWW